MSGEDLKSLYSTETIELDLPVFVSRREYRKIRRLERKHIEYIIRIPHGGFG